MSDGTLPLRPLLVIAGPTAVGKTELAIEVALRLGAEVISADAMQVYRGLDIGTDKPTPEQRRGVEHHLIDVADPEEPFNASIYRELARRALAAIESRGRLAIVCGGTGLYIRAFVDDLLPAPGGYDPSVRAHLEAQARREGSGLLYRRLAEVDPEAAARIHPHNVRRVIRALEAYEVTGKPLSELQREARRSARPLAAVWVGLIRPRPVLYERIHRRVDEQVARGLVDETRRLLLRGLGPGNTAMQALGYKEMARYLAGELTFARAVEHLKLATRHYARRQLTWFRPDPRIRWFDLSALGSLDAAAGAVARYYLERAAASGPPAAYR
ncbi:MAG: tRNA (adenosine(37)-N6)-dimethylallyltransferase MiaA [Bacillota bacterium]